MARTSDPAGEEAADSRRTGNYAGNAGGVVTVVYTESGVTKTYTAPASKCWDIVARADARFGIIEDVEQWQAIRKKWLSKKKR